MSGCQETSTVFEKPSLSGPSLVSNDLFIASVMPTTGTSDQNGVHHYAIPSYTGHPIQAQEVIQPSTPTSSFGQRRGVYLRPSPTVPGPDFLSINDAPSPTIFTNYSMQETGDSATVEEINRKLENLTNEFKSKCKFSHYHLNLLHSNIEYYIFYFKNSKKNP